MTITHWLNYSAIILIMGICSYLTYFISGAKYSFLKACIMALIKLDTWYIKWHFRNSIYLWCIVFRFMLICTELTLITLFAENSIFQRPFFLFCVAPLLWFSLFGLLAISLSNQKEQKA